MQLRRSYRTYTHQLLLCRAAVLFRSIFTLLCCMVLLCVLLYIRCYVCTAASYVMSTLLPLIQCMVVQCMLLLDVAGLSLAYYQNRDYLLYADVFLLYCQYIQFEATQKLEPLLIRWVQRWLERKYPQRYESNKSQHLQNSKQYRQLFSQQPGNIDVRICTYSMYLYMLGHLM